MKRNRYFQPETEALELELIQGLCENSPVTLTIEDVEEADPFDPKWDNFS